MAVVSLCTADAAVHAAVSYARVGAHLKGPGLRMRLRYLPCLTMVDAERLAA